MAIFKTSLILSCFFFLGAPAHALTAESLHECVKRMEAGDNQFDVKLPSSALKKIENGFKKYGREINTAAVLLVDYSKNSTEKRAYLIDFENCKVVKEEYVAHGGIYKVNGKMVNDGDPDMDGMLDKCKNRQGTRTNMTRPGLYITRGCHNTQQSDWTFINGDCEGIKLDGLESTNNDAMVAAVVLHEHEDMKNNSSIKAMGQGCPTFAKGKLKSMIGYGLFDKALVYVHAPQCR